MRISVLYFALLSVALAVSSPDNMPTQHNKLAAKDPIKALGRDTLSLPIAQHQPTGQAGKDINGSISLAKRGKKNKNNQLSGQPKKSIPSRASLFKEFRKFKRFSRAEKSKRKAKQREKINALMLRSG